MQNYPLVALVGRPNVGKSTLFNRIVGGRVAVVHDRPGTTRDRQYAEAEWRGIVFTLVDTGGIEDLETVSSGKREALAEDSADFLPEIRAQAEVAIAEADVIIHVVDLTTGITGADQEVADILRKANKPVLIAASKGDNEALRSQFVEFYALGTGEIFPISGYHGTGVGDLLDAIYDELSRRPPEPEEEDESLKIAIVGRPNVGKSSLLNRLLGEERTIVSPVAGTTRDAIDTKLTWHGEPLTLIDTAGIRKRGKIDPTVERWSVLRALKAIKRADVVLLLIDAIEGVTEQDTHVAGYIMDDYKSVIILVNKWDAVEKDTYTMVEFSEQARESFKFLSYAPMLYISALTGQRVNQVLPLAKEVWENRFLRISTAEVNRIVREAVLRQQPPARGGRRLKIRYASQVATNPPKFLFHVNSPKLVHFSYERYLENRIREFYPFIGTPILLRFRQSAKE
nr:ribosome biogenesis GTPase Der [Anaerolineae bacterium]